MAVPFYLPSKLQLRMEYGTRLLTEGLEKFGAQHFHKILDTVPPPESQCTFDNPLYDYFLRLNSEPYSILNMTARRSLVNHYSWAIPNQAAIDRIMQLSPIVEMGAGRGYWASCIKQLGGDIICYDSKLPPHEHAHHSDHTFHEVNIGMPPILSSHSDRALFLCWPPYQSPMADESLQAYKGEHVIYIGENGGCTATEAFQETLDREWNLLDEVSIPQFDGLHDYMMIYQR